MISNLTETTEYVIYCLRAGLTPMITGQPGIGKSAIVKQISDRFGLELIDIRLSTFDPVDLNGMPHVRKILKADGSLAYNIAEFIPMNTFPIEGITPLPANKNGWLILLDEFNSAPMAVQAASYKLVLDHMVGGHKLHSNAKLVAAGNLITDGAIVNRLGTAMQSRLVHIEMETLAKEWLDWASKAGLDHRILAYISHDPGNLHKFDSKHDDKTFPCHRTWEFMSRLIKNIPTTALRDLIGLFAGTVGEAAARTFVSHTQIYSRMPTYDDIVRDPMTAKVGQDPALLFGVAYMIANFCTKPTLDKAIAYLDRIPIEFQTICLQNLVHRDKSFIREKPITTWIAINGAKLF